MDDFTGADISAAMSGGSDAAASDAGASATTTTATTEPTAQQGAATTQPAATPTQPTTPTTPTKPPGPIPFDTHKTALENARTKAIEDYKAKVGWAEGVDKATFDQAVALARRTQSDPVGYVRELIAELQQHPTYGPALRSEAARALAAGRAAPAMPEPDVAITDEQGRVVGQTYSAAQLAKRDAWLKDQFLTEVRQEMAPVVKGYKTLEEQRQAEHDQAEGTKFASGLMTELKTYPHFDANKAAIRADVVQQIQSMGDDPRTNDPAWLEAATLRAYHRVVTTKQDALSRQAAVHDLQTKGTTSGVTPGRPPVGAPKPNTSGKFSGADLAEEFNRRKLG